MGQRVMSKGPQVQERISDETMGREEAVDMKHLCNRSPIKPRKKTIRWRNGALSGSDLATSLDWEVRGPTNQLRCLFPPSLGLGASRRMHHKMNSEATSSSSQLRPAVPTKRARERKRFRRTKPCKILTER